MTFPRTNSRSTHTCRVANSDAPFYLSIPHGVRPPHVCPGVEALCIFDCMRPKTPRPPLALRELRMPSVVSSPALRWFLPPDETHSTLRILQLSQPHVDDDDVFRNCARHITSLTLRRSPYPGFFEHFTALEELTIAGVWWQSPYPSFPKTLRHLRLQVARLAYDVLPEIADTIRQLPHLHTLSVKENLVQGRSSYPTLLQACRDKHVNILVDPRGDDAPVSTVDRREP
ncbi:hypothetical protein BC834DRAFT_155117 [Gloeopeniophorella convolvens]|nr:hypothetical protein BC834DRAFT_155117 [Gloeopeniophorella convolvens]